jgi:hypothetical protein
MHEHNSWFQQTDPTNEVQVACYRHTCRISIGVAKKTVRDWNNRNHKKHWESVTGLTQAYIRALCQKNEGSVEIKQRPTKMGGRTAYRTLPPKGAPFQMGVDWWSHLRKMPRRWISHKYPMWLWGCSSCKISSPGPVFHGTNWLLWRPHILSPILHSRYGINKGLIKRGSTINHWR